MRSKKFWSVYIGLALSAWMSSSVHADRIDLERIQPVPSTEKIPTADFFRTALLESPKLNPDGTHIAALVTVENDHYGLLDYEISTQKIEVIGAGGDRDIYYFDWLGSKRLLYFVGSNKIYGIAVFGVNLISFNRSYPVLQFEGASLVGIPPKRTAFPLIWARYDAKNSRDSGVLEVNTNLESGKAVKLVDEQNNWSAVMDADEGNQRHINAHYPVAPGGIGDGYYTAKEGNLKFAVTEDNASKTLYRFEDERWVKSPVDLEKVDFLTSGNTPDDAVVNGPRQENKPRALQWIDTKTGTLGDVLLQDDGYDFTGNLYRDPVSQAIVGAIYDRNGPHVTWFNDQYKALQKILDGFFPGLFVHLLGNDNSGHMFLVSTSSDRQPATFYWVNLETKKVGLIKKSAPWIDPKRMQPMNVIKFKTRDGRKLDAYLTLPAGGSKKNPPPLVVLPHGGPWVRDNWGFNPEAQFLASRGYAVLQPNYRGSIGYNWMFPESDQWAFRKMHDDVTDAAKAIITSGYVDPQRVAIMGSSFGGYLALSGAVNEPTLYKCAVTIAGVFDYGRWIENAKYDQFDSAVYAELKRGLGDPTKQKAKFDEISPLRHVDKVQIPVFVSHGTDDPRVDVGESKTLISLLEKYNVPHESLIVQGEGHGMHHIGNQVALYDRVDAFLAKYLHPTPPPLETDILTSGPTHSTSAPVGTQSAKSGN